MFFGGGTQTNALCIGGTDGSSVIAQVERWDGSSWSEITDLNTARTHGGTSGIYTAMLAFGGDEPSKSAKTEDWDGSSWTEAADLSTARRGATATPAGTSALALYAAGYSGSYVTSTEEWDAPAVFNQIHEGQLYFNSTTNTFKETIQDVATGTFSSGGALNTPRERFGGTTSTGGSTAAIGAGGDSPTIDSVEQYNGSSWSEITDLNTARGGNGGGAGTTTAMLAYSGGPSIVDNVESWNGSSWTETTEVNTGRYESKGGGTSTAALFYPGYLPPPSTARNNFEEWNGSSWTELADINRARSGIGAGTTSPTSAVIFAGSNPPPVPSPTPADASTETWNGSSWTEVNEMNTGRSAPGSFGTATSCIAASGYSGGFVENVEIWNGTSWTEINSMGTDGSNLSASGTTVAGLIFGGNPQPGRGTLTEEWTATLANKTITSS